MREARKLRIRALAPLIAALAVAALTCDAQAQATSAQQGAIRASCRSDFMAKCSGVTPGGKDALVCLQKNVNGLSPACKTAVAATLPPPAPAAAAKPAEAAPVAPAATSATAAPAASVATAPPPKAKVSAPPRKPAGAAMASPAPAPAAPAATAPTPVAVTPAAPAARPPKTPVVNAAVMLRACKLDLFRYCRGVTPGGGRELACLAAHEQDLTIRCKTARKVTSSLR